MDRLHNLRKNLNTVNFNMLLELKIKNLAIIDAITIDFGDGLNVITGETGAGKSILLAALNLVLGGRSDKDLIRTGEEEANVEAIFDNLEPVCNVLKEWGIDAEKGEPLILKRAIHVSGRSRAFVNCSSVPANQIRQIAPLLLDFGRQNEQSALMNPEKHIELVDRYSKQEDLSLEVTKKFREIQELGREYRRLKDEKSIRQEKQKFLNFQKKNIQQVNPQANEEEELTQDLKKLSAIDECRSIAKKIEKSLLSGAESIQEKLGETISDFADLIQFDNSLEHVLQDLENALIAVEESGRSLQAYQRQLNADPEQIEEIQERLEQIVSLQNSYGGTYESVMERLEEIEEELATLEKENQLFAKLTNVISKKKENLYQQAQKLSEERKNASKTLIPLIQKELHDLAMENASFTIKFTPVTENNGAILCINDKKDSYVANTGLETIHFLFSANKGEELRSLEKVASGGEMSRIMLAIKRIIGGAFAVPTVIFDEIDSGISGNASTSVAQKLRQIVEDKNPPGQIICISHTAQVAAEADQHFLVKKETLGERTHSQIRKMKYNERLNEVARMLAGDQSKQQALALAEKLVKK